MTLQLSVCFSTTQKTLQFIFIYQPSLSGGSPLHSSKNMFVHPFFFHCQKNTLAKSHLLWHVSPCKYSMRVGDFYNSELLIPISWCPLQAHAHILTGTSGILVSFPCFCKHLSTRLPSTLPTSLFPSSGQIPSSPGNDLRFSQASERLDQMKVSVLEFWCLFSIAPGTLCTHQLTGVAQRVLAEPSNLLTQRKGCGFYFSLNSLLQMNIKPCTQHKY